MNHFISIKDFTKEQLLEIIDLAHSLEEMPQRKLASETITASLFFEPSTRTRLSFTSAAYKIGSQVMGFDSPDATSIQKGETLRDTIKMVEAYSDAIIMRHPRDGSAKFASEISRVPIINAGDGANEHPSQTLLDLYTIKEEQGCLDNLKIAFIGDLKYGRTVHSLAKALALFDVEFYFVAPKNIQITQDILDELSEKNIKFTLLNDYKKIISEVDVMYVTRIQKERFEDPYEYEFVKNSFVVQKDELATAKKNMIILHPLPRVNEIDIDVDDTKHAKYFKQAANGIPVRQAIISVALEKLSLKNPKPEIQKDELVISFKQVVCQNFKCITHAEQTENKIIIKNQKKT
ncbi:MAG: aspartate carbamoyltransferase, partial [Fusobacteriaceae bacterium]